MKARAAYFACVEYLDEILGDFLGTLERDGLLDNTIIVYLSDHGEMAGEHGLWWKNFWHDASIRIPLIFKLPESMGASAGDRSDLANIIDVFPTLCGLAGLPIPDGLDGVDLRVGASDAGDSDEPRLVSQACHPRWGESTQFRVVTTRRYKYVHFRSAPELFFDLAEDPNEQENLADRATGEAARVLTEARRIAQSVADWEEVDAKRIEDSKRLEALYPKRANAKGPNQFILPDGRMVEAETTLYKPVVVSKAPQLDFPDWPDHKS